MLRQISLILFLNTVHIYANNIETRSFIREYISPHSSNQSSYFGQQVNIINETQPRFLLTSPKSNGTGSIYLCSDTSCGQTNPTFPPLEAGDAFGLSVALQGGGNVTACAPLRASLCQGVIVQLGFCYSGTENGLNWNPGPPSPNSCRDGHVEILFVVDGSSSINLFDPENFNTIKAWIADVVSQFDISPRGSTSVGVVQYATWAPPTFTQVVTEIRLGQYTSFDQFSEALDDITIFSGATFTANALRIASQDFIDSPRYNDPDNEKVLILLTDGQSNDRALLGNSSALLRSLNITTIAVGVAGAAREELQIVANGEVGNNERVYFTNNFDDLDIIVEDIIIDIEATSLEGTEVGQSGLLNELQLSQTGFSLVYTHSGLLVLGAVGAYDWSGSVAKYDSASDTTADIPDFTEVQLVLPNRTKESYLGYTVTTGNYNINEEFVASGAPRYLLQGAVVVYRPVQGSTRFDDARTIQAPLAYRQLGSYFGGSLLSTDINGDGRDDLLVGAPLYVSDNYDEGRVFVYLSQPSDSLGTWADESYEPQVLTGNNLPGGRFGSAIAFAGDLNKDNYNDIIIGAPLANDDRGSVFVYHGSAEGIQLMYKQEISAAELTGSNLQYFGQSLQAGVDLDGNMYPDVAVGAPKSDTVVIFRSRPVARFTSSLRFSQADVDIFDCFNTPNRQCLELVACLTVSGVSVENEVGIVFNISLDNNLNRIEFRTVANSTLTGSFTRSGNQTLQLNMQHCWSYDIYVKQNILDYSTDITAVMNFDLSPAHKAIPLSSVRDPSQPSSATAVAEFAKNCGDDDFCSYDLGLDGGVTIPPSSIDLIDPSLLELSTAGELVVIASDTANRPIQVRLNLTNNGENAFGTRVVITYSNLLSFTKLENVRSSNQNHPACLTDLQNDVITLPLRTKTLSYQFDTRLGNIMPENEWCYFELKFSTSNLRINGATDEVIIKVAAETASGTLNDTNIEDNTWNTTNQVRYRADVSANRITVEPTVPFNFTEAEFTNQTITSVQEIGINTSNIQVGFEIRGLGYANIPQSTVSLTFPSNVTEDDYILYLYRVDCNTDSETSSCSCQRNLINPYSLTEEAPNENNTDGNNITINPYPGSIGDRLIDCSNDVNGYCRTLTCTINNLAASQSIFLSAFFRLWTPTLRFANISEVTLRSVFEYDESSMLIINNLGQTSTQISLTTDIIARTYTAPQIFVNPNLLWVYIVAALGGLLLLVAIVLILYKTGFFKSKYADMKQEALDWNEVNPGSDDATDQLTT